MNRRDKTAGQWRTRRALPGVCLVLALLCGVPASAAAAISFQDVFANREVTTEVSDRVDGSNVGATIEPNEPRHGGKASAHSVWISWVAPTNGVATFWTDGSDIDTLLSAYSLPPGQTTLGQLQEVARNDDDPFNPPFSLIQFGARAGQRYEIAVDGFGGSVGDVRLRWDFIETTVPPPVILGVPPDQAVREGDTVMLTVDMQSLPTVDLQWRYNGNSFGQTGPTLVITNFQTTNVGLYSLRIRPDGQDHYEITPIELQINSEGQTNALATDKLIDSPRTLLIGDDDGGADDFAAKATRVRKRPAVPKVAKGVARGYDGSQIFDTTFATSDPNEPQGCGFAPSASYWYTYTPPTNGTLMINTTGSHYDNLATAYTYSGALTSYADLIPITCDHGSAGGNASRIEFAVVKGQQYVVVIAGVNGARGIARLNYHLDVSRQPLAPTLTNAPLTMVVAAGTDVDLQAAVIGSAPLRFSWRKASSVMTGATNPVLRLLDVAPTNSGDYVVTVSNYIGGPLHVTLPLRVVIPPRLQLGAFGPARTLSFPTVAGQRYAIEQTEALGGAWLPLSDSFVADGSAFVLSNSPSAPARFFRVRVE